MRKAGVDLTECRGAVCAESDDTFTCCEEVEITTAPPETTAAAEEGTPSPGTETSAAPGEAQNEAGAETGGEGEAAGEEEEFGLGARHSAQVSITLVMGSSLLLVFATVAPDDRRIVALAP